MTMDVRFELLWPEFLVAGLAFLVFTLDFFIRPARKEVLAWVSAAGLAVIIAFTVPFLLNEHDSLFDGLYRVDSYALFFKVLSMGIGIAVILGSLHFVDRRLTHPGEYYAIIIVSVLAMMMMAASGELLTAYLSLELLSFCLYILSGFALQDRRSNEASVKYVLLGAFSSGLLLYGIVLLYGALGTTHFAGMAAALETAGGVDGRLLVGLALVVAGLGFKLAAVPFHMWAPDVYQGAPMPITAYIAVGSKAAAFALALRLFYEALAPAYDEWRLLIAGMAALTMLFGNVVAIVQTNVKRMLAYSSVGQVGFLLMGIAALSPLASNALMVHLVGYSVTNFAVFFAITAFYNATGKDDIPDFAGLAGRVAVPGGGDHRGAVLAGGAAVPGGVRDEVLPLLRRGRRGAAVAGGRGDGGESDLALLLPHAHPADVHRGGAGGRGRLGGGGDAGRAGGGHRRNGAGHGAAGVVPGAGAGGHRGGDGGAAGQRQRVDDAGGGGAVTAQPSHDNNPRPARP